MRGKCFGNFSSFYWISTSGSDDHSFNDYNEPTSPQSSLSGFSQNTSYFTEFKNCLHGSNSSLNDDLEAQEAYRCAFLTAIDDSKTPQKKQKQCTCFFIFLQENNILRDGAFLTSIVLPHYLALSSTLVLHRDVSLTSQFSTEKFQFKPQLTSHYLVSTT